VRVVAGIHKGRRLHAPPGRDTRPTSDRVREALFQLLGPLDGVRVLDLFAGSGALAIEALSRGAASAVLVDADPRAVAAIRRNLEPLGADAEVRRCDALAFLRAYDGAPFGLVLLDPPYSSGSRLAGGIGHRLSRVITDNARIVTESDKRTPLQLDLPLDGERTYGDTRIAIHRGA
jgi:16S rRNA (guanine966-N2)-methyltransferase